MWDVLKYRYDAQHSDFLQLGLQGVRTLFPATTKSIYTKRSLCTAATLTTDVGVYGQTKLLIYDLTLHFKYNTILVDGAE
jgi:hypothetical protein